MLDCKIINKGLKLIKSITVCITSFNRFNLLKQTIDSFNKLNKYPIEKYLVIEDSANLDMKDKIINNYGNEIELIFNENTLGQAKSIDKAYQTITSEYVFHSEDDYLYIGNANFMQDSLDVLEEREDIHQIWMRHLDNYDETHGVGVIDRIALEKKTLYTSTNVPYRMIKSPHDCLGNYGGFSWNSGLRRMADYKSMFPNGYDFFIKIGKASMKKGDIVPHVEEVSSKHALMQGYRAAFLVNGGCRDMGHLATTY